MFRPSDQCLTKTAVACPLWDKHSAQHKQVIKLPVLCLIGYFWRSLVLFSPPYAYIRFQKQIKLYL